MRPTSKCYITSHQINPSFVGTPGYKNFQTIFTAPRLTSIYKKPPFINNPFVWKQKNTAPKTIFLNSFLWHHFEAIDLEHGYLKLGGGGGEGLPACIYFHSQADKKLFRDPARACDDPL